MGIVILSHIQPNFYQIVPQVQETAPLIESFINNINPQISKSCEVQWNLAKEKYVNDIMDPDFRPELRRDRKRFNMDFYGSEYSKLIVHFRSFLIHSPRRVCTPGCQLDGFIDINKQEHSIFLIRINNQINLVSEWRGKCSGCGIDFETTPYFGQKNPNFLIIQTNPNNISFYETPDTLVIDNRNFKLLCVTIKIESRNHFVSVFRINNNNFYLDGIGRLVEPLPQFDQRILNQRNVKGYEKYYKSFINSALYYLI